MALVARLSVRCTTVQDLCRKSVGIEETMRTILWEAQTQPKRADKRAIRKIAPPHYHFGIHSLVDKYSIADAYVTSGRNPFGASSSNSCFS